MAATTKGKRGGSKRPALEKSINVRVPVALYEQIQALAEAQDEPETVSMMARRLLREALAARG